MLLLSNFGPRYALVSNSGRRAVDWCNLNRAAPRDSPASCGATGMYGETSASRRSFSFTRTLRKAPPPSANCSIPVRSRIFLTARRTSSSKKCWPVAARSAGQTRDGQSITDGPVKSTPPREYLGRRRDPASIASR